jgi:chromosome segregation ATPase
LIDNLKKECYANFFSIPQGEKLSDRVDVLNSRLREVESRQNKTDEGLETALDRIQRHSDDIGDLRQQVSALVQTMREIDRRTDKNERDIAELFEKLAALLDKIKEIESALDNSQAGDIDDLMKRLKELEKLIADKVDCDLFDNEIAALTALIGNMEDGKGTSIPVTSLPPPRPAGP